MAECYIKYNIIEWIKRKKQLEEELNRLEKLDSEFVDIRTKYEKLLKKYNLLKEM